MNDSGNTDTATTVIIAIPEEGMKPGLTFPREECPLNTIQKWSEKVLCPLIKTRRTKSMLETNGESRGRRTLDCPHGRERNCGNNEKRPQQNVEFSKCPVHININEAEDGSWYTTKNTSKISIKP